MPGFWKDNDIYYSKDPPVSLEDGVKLLWESYKDSMSIKDIAAMCIVPQPTIYKILGLELPASLGHHRPTKPQPVIKPRPVTNAQKHTRNRLFTDEQVREMRSQYNEGKSVGQIAKLYDTYYAAIYSAVTYRTYRFVKDSPIPPPTPVSKKLGRPPRFTDEEVRDIRKRYAYGETIQHIASGYNVCYSTIGEITRRVTYKHVKD